MQALNVTYEEEEKRGLIQFQAVAIGMTVAAVLFAIVALTLVAAIPAMIQFLPFSRNLKIVGVIAPWPILIVLVAVGARCYLPFCAVAARKRNGDGSAGAVS
jgi:membrane protein